MLFFCINYCCFSSDGVYSLLKTAVKSICFSSLRLVLYTKYFFMPVVVVQEVRKSVCGTNKVNEISIWCSATTATTYTSSFHSLTFAWVTNKGPQTTYIVAEFFLKVSRVYFKPIQSVLSGQSGLDKRFY